MAKMSNLKKILSEYEGEFNPNGWAQLEKRLPKQTFMQKFGKFIVGGAAGALVVAGVLVAVLWNYDEKPQSEEPIAKAEITNAVQESTGDENAVSVSDQTSMPSAEISESKQTATATEIAETPNTEIAESKVETEPAKQTEQPAVSNEKQDVASNNQDNQPKQTPKVVTEPSFSVSCDSHCTPATASFVATGVEADCEVVWEFGNGKQAKGSKVTFVYEKKGTFKPVATLYRNGTLVKKTELASITVNETPKADFTWRSTDNTYKFYTERTVNLAYKWEIDNKSFTDKSVEYEFVRSGNYPVKFVLTDGNGCSAEATKSVKVVISHVFFVPNAFTPDSDGVNSTFGPIGEDMDFKTFSFGITNSRGEAVFTSTDPAVQWNGKVNNVGPDVEAGVYYWIIKTVDHYGNSQTRKGTVNVMR